MLDHQAAPLVQTEALDPNNTERIPRLYQALNSLVDCTAMRPPFEVGHAFAIAQAVEYVAKHAPPECGTHWIEVLKELVA